MEHKYNIDNSTQKKNNKPIKYISNKINLITDDTYSKIIAKDNIKKGDILIIEYSDINLFGEILDNRELKILKKYLENKNQENIIKLYPRNNNYVKTSMIKSIHNMIKQIKNTDTKLYNYLIKYSKSELEFYFAKYIYNAFEGNDYGPLTLPYIAKINHSCNPNVKFKFNRENYCMYLISIRNIKKGEELYASYLENKNIKNHKDYLYEHYGFSCDCII
jgi:hypothetical protein